MFINTYVMKHIFNNLYFVYYTIRYFYILYFVQYAKRWFFIFFWNSHKAR
jgi:hypothetical protein